MTPTGARKRAHLAICAQREVESGRPSGLADYALEYDALPEVDLAAVDLGVTLLGRRLSAPIVIGAMSGGTGEARRLNLRLAQAAARHGLGLALGSQRPMLEDPALAEDYALRRAVPDLPLLIGNIGAGQLVAQPREAGGPAPLDAAGLQRLVSAIGADALAIHLNPLQEAVQPEGQTRYRGLWRRLTELLPAVRAPVLIKEVGHGLSAVTAAKLASLPLAGVEVAGVGGTSWALVEALRLPAEHPRARLGRRLAGVGVPTAESIVACRRALGPTRVVLGAGGVRTGHDAAIALALGADAVAVARPLLRAALAGERELDEALALLLDELRVLMFCAGAEDLAALRRVRLLDRWGQQVERP